MFENAPRNLYHSQNCLEVLLSHLRWRIVHGTSLDMIVYSGVGLEDILEVFAVLLESGAVDLENCTSQRWVFNFRLHTSVCGQYHRQDSKSLRWMPWHQESMKDVDGCDKPR